MEELEIALEELNQTIMSLDNDFILEKRKILIFLKQKTVLLQQRLNILITISRNLIGY